MTYGKSNLIKFFGDNPFNRIMDALIDNIGESFSKKELQELSGISKGAFFAHWPKAEGLGIAKITKEIGRTKLYALNTGNQLVKDILKFEMRMIEETAPKKIAILARTRPFKSGQKSGRLMGAIKEDVEWGQK